MSAQTIPAQSVGSSAWLAELEAELERKRALAKRILLVTGFLPWEMLGIIAKLKARVDTERGHSDNVAHERDDEAKPN